MKKILFTNKVLSRRDTLRYLQGKRRLFSITEWTKYKSFMCLIGFNSPGMKNYKNTFKIK